MPAKTHWLEVIFISTPCPLLQLRKAEKKLVIYKKDIGFNRIIKEGNKMVFVKDDCKLKQKTRNGNTEKCNIDTHKTNASWCMLM